MIHQPPASEKPDPDSLVAGWIKHEMRGSKDEEYFWAWDTLYYMVQDDPEAAWPIILRLVEESPTNLVLACVAAGPLEDLLCEHGPSFIDRVLDKASFDVRFRKCLRAVWGWNSMDKGVRARIDEAVKYVPLW